MVTCPPWKLLQGEFHETCVYFTWWRWRCACKWDGIANWPRLMSGRNPSKKKVFFFWIASKFSSHSVYRISENIRATSSCACNLSFAKIHISILYFYLYFLRGFLLSFPRGYVMTNPWVLLFCGPMTEPYRGWAMVSLHPPPQDTSTFLQERPLTQACSEQINSLNFWGMWIKNQK